MKLLRSLLSRLFRNGCKGGCNQGREPCAHPFVCFPDGYAPLRDSNPMPTLDDVSDWLLWALIGILAVLIVLVAVAPWPQWLTAWMATL